MSKRLSHVEDDRYESRTSKLCYSKQITENEINKDKTEKRYKLMMSKLNEIESQEKKEKDRVKSARVNKKNNDPSEKSHVTETNNQVQTLEIDPEKETLRAPNELLEEFLVYIMQKNWTDALKLCGFILMYEPHHETAKEYLPILEIKVAQLESQGESSSGSDEESSDDISGSDSTEDDSDDDSSSDNSSDEKEKIKELVKKVENEHNDDDDDDDDVQIPDSFKDSKSSHFNKKSDKRSTKTQ